MDDRYIITEETWGGYASVIAPPSSESNYLWEAWYADSPYGFIVESGNHSLHEVQRDIEALVRAFRLEQQKKKSLATWRRLGLDVLIRCQCGHYLVEAVNTFMSRCGQTPEVFSLAPRLCCSVCGKKGTATIVPASYQCTNGLGAVPDATSDVGGSLRDLYVNLGGDGVQNVYMSDGVYLTPDGESIDEHDN